MKGYKVLNLHTRKISISRDVVFHENVFPFSSSSQSLLSPPLSFPFSSPSTHGLDSSSCPVFVLIPIVATTPIVEHLPSSQSTADTTPLAEHLRTDTNSSILMGSLPVSLDSNV